MLKVIGEKSKITAEKEIIESSDGIILPGVGAYDSGMERLNEAGLTDVIIDQARTGKPILGICLGMQLLGRGSEEGRMEGLSLLPFECKRFYFSDTFLKVPHMGWDIVEIEKKHPLIDGITGQQRYYFVHSYYASCDSIDTILMTCNYGHKFVAAVAKDNIMGVQFHPEKSHDFGMTLLSNFVKMCKADGE